MKIVGIDIAIENLAFCGLTASENGEDMKMIKDEWFVLDTTPEDYNQECIYHNKKKCNKKAGWYYIEKETEMYHFYCSTHKNVINKNQKIAWKTLNKNFLNSNDVIKSIFKKLDENLEFFTTADYIIIEKQPPKNPKMISIMNYIYSYFVLKLWNDRKDSKLKDIIILDAKNKVNYCLEVLDDSMKKKIEEKYNPKKNKYQYYKNLSISTVRQELKENDVLLEYFNSFKKMDDLADSRNMVLWWLKKFSNKKEKETKKKRKKSTLNL